MRQKLTLASSTPNSAQLKQGRVDIGSKVLENRDPASDKIPPIKLSQEGRNTRGVDTEHTLRPMDQKDDISGSEDSKLVDSTGKGELSKESPSMGGLGGSSFMLEHGCSTGQCQRIEGKCHETLRKSHSCSKANDKTAGARALRYALHLRFVCPSPKKYSRSVQRCKSDPLSVPQNRDMEGERRFYLYNDLRVVFPQRHSDTDEGKVCGLRFYCLLTAGDVLLIWPFYMADTGFCCLWQLNVEYHFPEDPRYFAIN